jgi:hypothetical protein
MITKDDCSWYSYTHNKYYCRDCHEYSGVNLLEIFKKQDDFISHMKMRHSTTIDKFTLPKQNITHHAESNLYMIEPPT